MWPKAPLMFVVKLGKGFLAQLTHGVITRVIQRSCAPTPAHRVMARALQVLTTVVSDARDLLEVRRSEAALKTQLAEAQAKLKVCGPNASLPPVVSSLVND